MSCPARSGVVTVIIRHINRIMKMDVGRVRRLGPGLALAAALGVASCSDDSPSGPRVDPPLPEASAMLEFQAPAEGAMLQEGSADPSPVDVMGTACDSLATVTGVAIDGVDQTLSGAAPCFDFSTTVQSRWGLNTIEAVVSSDNGVAREFLRSYLRSPDYFTVQVPKSAARRADESYVPGGVVVRLDESFIDDGARGGGGSVELDDLASLFEVAMRSVHFGDFIGSELVPGPGTKTCNCLWPIPDITIHDGGARVTGGTLDYGDPEVLDVELRSGGFSVSVGIGDFHLPVSVTGYLGDCITSCVDRLDTRVTVDGDLSLSQVDATVSVDVGVSTSGGPLVSVPSVVVELTGLAFDMDWGLLEFLDDLIGISNLTNSIVRTFETSIESAVAGALSNMIPQLTASFLDNYRPQGTVTLAEPLGVRLAFTSWFDQIDFTPQGALLGIRVGVVPAIPRHETPRGSIARGGAAPVFAAPVPGLSVAVKDDLLNQFLWASWLGGALDLQDLTALDCGLPAGRILSLGATLPPVIMPATGTSPLEIGVGGLEVVVSLDPEDAARLGAVAEGQALLSVSVLAGASLGVDPAGFRFAVDLEENYEVTVAVIEAPEGTDLAALAAENEVALRCLLPQLLDSMLRSYPLPSVAIGNASLAGVPPGAVWELGNPSVERQAAYTAVSGEVVVR